MDIYTKLFILNWLCFILVLARKNKHGYATRIWFVISLSFVTPWLIHFIRGLL